MKKLSLLAFIIILFFTADSEAARRFTVTMPAGSAVVMNDNIDTLTFTVNNTSTAGEQLRRVRFTFPAAYTVEYVSIPPNGWTVTYPASTRVEFQASAAAYYIPSGGSQTFNVVVKGPNWGPFTRAASDATDTLSNAQAWEAGGQTYTLQGALPSWARKSLAVTIVASPTSVGLGGLIQVEMQVENRSTANQNGITANPDPPGATYTGGASVTLQSGPVYSPNPLNLTPLQIGTITWNYTAGATGTVYFTTSARNGAVVTSKTKNSNIVFINAFTAYFFLDPLTAATGQNVNVWMYVQNNGFTTTLTDNPLSSAATTVNVSSTANFPNTGVVIIDGEQISYTSKAATQFLNCSRGVNGTTAASHNLNAFVTSTVAMTNITPSITPIGSATETLSSGPLPPVIGAIPAGGVGLFQWIYNITGNVGQTYQFQGSASADGPVTSTTATSDAGYLSNVSVTVTPSTVPSGSGPVTLNFTVYNRTGQPINRIYFYHANSTFCNNYTSAVSSGCGAWTAANGGCGGGGIDGPLRLFAGTSIPNGGNCTFAITYSSVPNVTNDTNYAFPMDLYQGGTFRGTGNGTIMVTAYRLTLTNSPPGPINADGSSTYTISATLTNISTGLPVPGKLIQFTTTNGLLSASTVLTDASGIAIVTLKAPYSTVNTSALVKGKYINTEGTVTVNFTGVTTPNLQYIGGLSPMVAKRGNSYPFSVNIKNYGASAVTLNTGTTFNFTDGTTIYSALLTSGVIINAGGNATLTFTLTNVSPSFFAGAYNPYIRFSGTGFTSYNYTISDMVTIPPQTRVFFWRERSS